MNEHDTGFSKINFRMWGRALTDQEVKILYENTDAAFGLATRPEESKYPDLWEGFIDNGGTWRKIDGAWKLTTPTP